jgi:hypothetical protein
MLFFIKNISYQEGFAFLYNSFGLKSFLVCLGFLACFPERKGDELIAAIDLI